MKCLKCSYNWTPRVNQPKECPECKARLHKFLENNNLKIGGN